jgi:hypothetical protein
MQCLSGVRNLSELAKDKTRGRAEFLKLKKLLKGVQVKTTYTNPPRYYKIESLVLEGALYEFELQDNRCLTVEVRI